MEGTLSEVTITTTKKRRMEEKRGFARDMIFEVLTWLPAKSLMRFRCVSKAWNSFIRHDPHFVKLHNARSQTRPLASRLLFEIGTRHREVVESTSNFPTQLEGFSLQLARPRHYFDFNEITICSNHCNGLVCFYNRKDTQSYLYNVTTGEIKALPSSLRLPKGSGPTLFLGFDQATERYKLLHVIFYTKKPRIKILTLGTTSWRIIRGDQYPVSCCFHTCIFLNGVVYWIEYHRPVIYFNFTEEKFVTLSLPQRSSWNTLNKMQTALWGKLSIYCRFQHERCNLVYDEVNKIFVKSNSTSDLENEKVALLAPKNVGEKITECGNIVLATGSVNSASTSLVFPDRFRLDNVSSFVENIIPLTFIEV
ncbi:F-box protein At2g23160-like [Nicotiana tomentosiformis]|uniref:F-box protein At2g23160-like n=1 Tax=Nicotiana tomentosiformis TaxID=4098 RepID=UPI00051C84C5|nr:putative F-box protein At1g50870 [Nicotiana tomentosiformis]